MKEATRTRLKTVLNNDNITIYEVTLLLNALCQEEPLRYTTQLEESTRRDVNASIDLLKKSYKQIQAYIKKNNDLLYDSFREIEAGCEAREKQFKIMSERMEELFEKKINVPFNDYYKLIDLCNSYAQMSPEAKSLFLSATSKDSTK